MHIHRHENTEGELIDLSYFCSDWCHRDWCRTTSNAYEGWDGCHEIDGGQVCANCQEVAK